jgi:Abortive infection alpha
MSDQLDRAEPRRRRSRDDPESAEVPALSELFRVTPGLARIAVAASWRSAGWAARAYGRAASRVARAATSDEPATQFLQEVRADLREYARGLLDISNGAGRSGGNRRELRQAATEASVRALRRRGAELLRQSAELEVDDLHPAYMRILEALTPDEGRILRFLALSGPQPAVDVRAGLPLASELVSQGRTMIGEEAGCLHGGRIHPYLDNLHRLGLIWFSREPVSEPRRYQVLEAQPDVVEALSKGGRLSRTVRRSILLTPFGEDFCAVCLPLGDDPPPSRSRSEALGDDQSP